MHWHIVEIAPAAPALVEALPPLLILSGLLFALGCVVLIDAFVRGLFGGIASLFSGIPLIGGLTSGAIHKAEQAISNALGSATAGIERNIGHQFHNLARVADHAWHAMERTALVTWHLANLLASLPSLGNIQHAIAVVRREISTIEHGFTKTITRVIHHTRVEVQSVAQGVYPRLRALEHEITKTIPKEIKSARALAREAEDGVGRLWDRVRKIEASLSTTAIAAVVATVLAAIGLDWIACRNGASRVGRTGCNIWDDLGKLFGWLVDLYIFTNLCSVMADLEPVVQDVAQPLISELYNGIELWPCIVNHEPPVFPVPALHLPQLSVYPVHNP